MPKVGPLVAELLSGFTALLLAYFALTSHDAAQLLHENSGIAVGASTIIAWLLGTFFDALRNWAVEEVWDRFPSCELKWDFFIKDNPEMVANVEQYFFSFYRIDIDIAIAIVLFLACGSPILVVFGGGQGHYYSFAYSLGKSTFLFAIALVFFLDARSLRLEMRKYMQ